MQCHNQLLIHDSANIVADLSPSYSSTVIFQHVSILTPPFIYFIFFATASPLLSYSVAEATVAGG